MICANWDLWRVWVFYKCKFLHLANCIRLISATWDGMDTEYNTVSKNTEYTLSISGVLSPTIWTHLAGVVTMTFCQFIPSQGFKPIVPDSQKAGTVGGIHNTSLSSLALKAMILQQSSSHESGQMLCDTHYCAQHWCLTLNLYRFVMKTVKDSMQTC